MELNNVKNDRVLTVEVIGRLDTNTAPELEKNMEEQFSDDLENIVFDFSKLEYVSSAGLRVLLATSKRAASKGIDFKITHANEEVMDVFEVTGFLDILNVEN